MVDIDDRLAAARDAISAMDPHADLWVRAVAGSNDPAARAGVIPIAPAWPRRSRWLAWAAAIAVVALGAALLQSGDDEKPVATVPRTTIGRPSGWSGPVRPPSKVVHPMAIDEQFSFDLYGETHFGRKWDDPRDVSVDYADIVRVNIHLTSWSTTLAAFPPQAAEVEPGVVIAYGLVFDTDGDGAADYVVGIDNDAPVPGDVHVWLTNLATGVTDERSGPPYGYPVEFSYPTEPEEGEVGRPPVMFFTFLGGALPADAHIENARLYAWTYASRDGVVFAHDYAPDTGWVPGGGL